VHFGYRYRPAARRLQSSGFANGRQRICAGRRYDRTGRAAAIGASNLGRERKANGDGQAERRAETSDGQGREGDINAAS